MRLKPEEGLEEKAKINGLEEQAKGIEQQLQTIDREIERLKRQQIDKKQLRQIFRDFSEIYSEATAETKRRLLNIIIEEISCLVRKRRAEFPISWRFDSSSCLAPR